MDSQSHSTASTPTSSDIENKITISSDQPVFSADEKCHPTTTTITAPTPPVLLSTPSPPPDGGLTAWLQVLAAHLVIFNSWGQISSFGIFQTYYATEFSISPSAISWIGSVEVFLIFFIGTFAGRATDAGYFRPVILTGLFLQLLGIFTTSISKTYWQLFLAQGVCQGLGDGLLFCPVVALVSTYFSKKRAFAIACTASGGATGGLVFPAIAQNLLNRIGFGWTIRVMGFIMLLNASVIASCARPRTAPRKAGRLVEWSAFAEPAYALFAVGAFISWLGLYWIYFYVRAYARDVLRVDERTSFSLLLLLNGIGLPGRVIPGLIADRYTGPLPIYIAAVAGTGVIVLCWTGVSSLTGYWVFVAFAGWTAATFQGLYPSSLASLTTDLSKAGTRTGMVSTIVSFACLTGPPVAGAIIQRDGGRYTGAQIYGGVLLIVGSLVLVGSKCALDGRLFVGLRSKV